MPKKPLLELISGEVVNVQLTSETHVAQRGKAGIASRIVNKMRVFYKDRADGKERDVTFVNSTVGVHEGHVITIARARTKKGPALLALINESTGQREDYESGFKQAAKPQGMFGARWKAVGLSALLFVFGILLSHYVIAPGHNIARAIAFSLMFSLLAFPVLWAIVALWDRFSTPMSENARQAELRREIETLTARVKKGQPGHA